MKSTGRRSTRRGCARATRRSFPRTSSTRSRAYAWTAKYYRDDYAFSSADLACESLFDALRTGGSVSYEALLAALPLDGIIEDFGAPTAQIEVTGVSQDAQPDASVKAIGVELHLTNWEFDPDTDTTEAKKQVYVFYLSEEKRPHRLFRRADAEPGRGRRAPAGQVSAGWTYFDGAVEGMSAHSRQRRVHHL